MSGVVEEVKKILEDLVLYSTITRYCILVNSMYYNIINDFLHIIVEMVSAELRLSFTVSELYRC